ncbi:MAG: hypothetical protein WA705_10515 [Candidatus Ozemobacteraceae bacterium]
MKIPVAVKVGERRSAFTLMEVIIAGAILIAFMAGVLTIYRSGAASFAQGSWKSKAQKDAQIFLEELRFQLEHSGNALSAGPTAITSTTLPIYLHANAATGINVRGFADLPAIVPVAFMSMVTPSTQNSLLARVRAPGAWMCGYLSGSQRTLYLRTYNDRSAVPAAVNGYANVLPLGGDFVAAPITSLRGPQILNQVESLQMALVINGTDRQVEIRVVLSRLGNPPGKSDTRVAQSVRAKLCEDMTINTL